MKEVVVVGGARTAIGTFGSGLKTIPVVELGSIVMKDVFRRTHLRPVASEAMEDFAPDKLKGRGRIELEDQYGAWDDGATPVTVDEVIMGNVLQAAQGQNPARQAMVRAGISKETPALTINKVCGSGLKAIAIGAAAIMSGQADVILAGGQESMSTVPMALPKARWGHRMELTGVGDIYDLMVFDGLYEIFYGYHMGLTAENIAELYHISREEQDALAVLSHQRARKAITDGDFAAEIVPVSIKSRKGETLFDTDERPLETDMQKMARLRPAFKKDGTVTAGNASGINDGAAAVLLMSAEKALELGLEPIVKIKAFASGGVDPAYMGLGPIPSIRKILIQENLNISDFSAIELNEAFAAQAIGCIRELNCDIEKTNKLGSGISIGHPIGCSGARILVTLVHTMKREGGDLGLASLCIGGGQGMAVALEQV